MTETTNASPAQPSGGEPGKPEPKSREDWARRGAEGGEPGRSPPVPGGANQGSGDRSDRSNGGRADVEREVGRPPQPRPGEG